jgi:hypothetical protein
MFGRAEQLFQLIHTPLLYISARLPSHASKSKDSFYVNVRKNVWYCHSDSCKANGKKAGGNVIDFVQAMENCSAYEAAKKLSEKFLSGPAAPQPAEKPAPVVEENKPLAFTLKDIACCEYLKQRGISEETAAKFGVGLFPGNASMARRVVIPIRDENGALVAYAGRAIGNEQPKYRLPNGFHKISLRRLDGLHAFRRSGEAAELQAGRPDVGRRRTRTGGDEVTRASPRKRALRPHSPESKAAG